MNMGIVKSKIKSWGLPQLVCTVTQLILLMHSIILCFISNKGLLEECDMEENVETYGAATMSCLKEDFKRFVQCHVFAQSPPGQRPSGRYPVNTSHRCLFV
jgi:hypothetical protein